MPINRKTTGVVQVHLPRERIDLLRAKAARAGLSVSAYVAGLIQKDNKEKNEMG